MLDRVRHTTPRLLLLSSLPAIRRENGDWRLPTKFVDGLKAYAERWPGEVVAGLQPGSEPSADLDNEWWDSSALSFDLEPIDFRLLAQEGHALLDGAIVMGIPHHDLHGLARQCRRRGSVHVVNTELTPRTQLQIARETLGLGPRLLRTSAWLILEHRRVMREISDAHGLQCNGTPTYDAYSGSSKNPLLYFDSRTIPEMLIAREEIAARITRFEERQRIRILFSGRLSPIKGVHHLVPMADALRRRDMDFELWIAGDGPLRKQIDADIHALGLDAQVRCLGSLDFSRELMPLLRDEIDVFACPHLQGDPSCTYLETMAAGVPIVGYGNEAWRGLQQRSGAGLVSPRTRPAALATAISALASNPVELRQLSFNAAEFAAEHLFDQSFDRRIKHLETLSLQVHSTAAC